MRAGLFFSAAALVFCTALAGTGWEDKFFSGRLPLKVYTIMEDPVHADTLLSVTRDYPYLFEGYITGTLGWMPAEGATPQMNGYMTCIAALGQEVWVGGEFTLDYVSSVAHNHLYRRDVNGTDWHPVTTAAGKEGLNGNVNAIVNCGGSIYVAGAFTGDSTSTISLKRVAKWNAGTQSWVDLGGGVDGPVNALACGPTAGSLWVAGAFNNVGSGNIASPKLAYWSGSAWAAVTDGSGNANLAATVYSLVDDRTHNGVWVGGDMTACGAAASCKRVAFFGVTSYSTTVTGTWKTLPDGGSGNGVSATVRALYCDAGCANVYAGGDFLTTGSGATLNYITRFSWADNKLYPITDGTGTGLNGLCRTITGFSTGALAGSILFGGDFTGYDGNTEGLGGVVAYDGTHFSYVGRNTNPVGGGLHDGVNSLLYSIVLDPTTQIAYMGGEGIGNFGNKYDNSMGNLLAWDQATDIITGLGFNAVAMRLAQSGNKLYIAGYGTDHGCTAAWVYDITAATFSCFKDSAGHDATINGRLFTMASTPTTVYLGGLLVAVGYAATNTWLLPASVVAYDTATGAFSALRDLSGGMGPSTSVFRLYVSSSGALYAGGKFRSLSGVAANNLLAWDGTGYSSPLNGGVGELQYDAVLGTWGTIKAMAFINGKIHVGGQFKTGSYASNYAVVDPATGAWTTGYSATGGIVGLGRLITTIADDGAGGVLLGGDTAAVDSVSLGVETVMRVSSAGALDSTSGVGSGPSYVNSSVHCSVLFSSQRILAGSFGTVFTTSGSSAPSSFALWDGTQLTRPSFLTSTTAVVAGGSIYAMVEYQGKLVIAGDFTTAGGVTARGIAMHSGVSGAAWSPLVSGQTNAGLMTKPKVRALAVDGTDLYVAGVFTQAGGVFVLHIARWDGAAWRVMVDSRAPAAPGIQLNVGDATNRVSALAMFNGELYIGGSFFGAGPHSGGDGFMPQSLVKWNPTTSSYHPVGLGTGQQDCKVHALLVASGKLFIGGERLRFAPTVSANYIAKYQGGQWSAIGPDGRDQRTPDVVSDNGVNGYVYSIGDANLDDGNGRTLLVGGTYTAAAGGVTAGSVASVSAAAGGWASFPPDAATTGVTGVADGIVYNILQDPTSSIVLVTGDYKREQGGANRVFNSLAGWSPVATGWQQVGDTNASSYGVTGSGWSTISDIAFNPPGAAPDRALLVVGYAFTKIGGVRASGLGRLNSMASLPFAASPSASPSVSPSASPSPSCSASPSPSSSTSLSATPSPSTSVSVTASPSASTSASPSKGTLPSASPSPSSSSGASGPVVGASASASPSASASSAASASASSALSRTNLLLPYTLQSADLCSAEGLLEAVLDPDGGVGPTLRGRFAAALGYNVPYAFINAVLACNGAYASVSRDAPVNTVNTTVALRRRLGVDANNRLTLVTNGRTVAVELGLSVPSALAVEMAAFLQVTVDGGSPAQIAAAAAALNSAITSLAAVAPDQVPSAAVQNAIATIISSNGASGGAAVASSVSGVIASIVQPLVTSLNLSSSVLAGIQTGVVTDAIRVTAGPNNPGSEDGKGLSKGEVAGLVVGLLFLAGCCCWALFFVCRKRKREREEKEAKQVVVVVAAQPPASAAAAPVEFTGENPMLALPGSASAEQPGAPKRARFKQLPTIAQ